MHSHSFPTDIKKLHKNTVHPRNVSRVSNSSSS